MLVFDCYNTLYLDGSHEGKDVMEDTENMRLLADPTYHRVLIDDVELAEVVEYWNAFAKVCC